jgi:GGDEF domain-containing protein
MPFTGKRLTDSNEDPAMIVGLPDPAATGSGSATSHAVREQYAKMFDRLTALPGWPLLIDRTHIALERAARCGFLVAVVILKDVRRASSASADFTTFISLLRDGFYGDDTVARIDGCTFVVVLNDVSNRDAVATAVDGVVEGSGIICRIGIAFGASPSDPTELIDEALQDAAPPTPTEAAPWWQGFDEVDFATEQADTRSVGAPHESMA